MFNNCNPKTNGEYKFFMDIKDKINRIFDVGCRSDSDFIEFTGEVHYFDPVNEFIEKLKTQQNMNKASYFNSFGLGEDNKELYYYPRYQSFYDRINSCSVSDNSNKIVLHIKKGKDYINNNNIKNIDFLKIDTEGYELNVLQGSKHILKKINYVIIENQFFTMYLNSKFKKCDTLLLKNNFKLLKRFIFPLLNFEDRLYIKK